MHSSEPDIWNAGRATQRAEVQAAFAPRLRRCPHCGHEQTGGVRCDQCGQEMVLRRRGLGRRRVALICGLVLAVGAAATLAIVPGMLDSAHREERDAAARQARLEAAERARLAKDVLPRTAPVPARRPGEDRLAYRGRLIAAGETAITADARKRIAAGTMDGPVAGTSCSPFPVSYRRRALEADPSVPKGRYECIAYERKLALSKLEGKARTGVYGAPYWLVLDYSGAPMTFCKITPRPGEGGKALVNETVPAVCLDPLRKR